MAAGRVLPAKITYDRDLHIPDIDRGSVIWRGVDGRLKVSVFQYVDGKGPMQTDTISDGTLVDKGDHYELTGVSDRLVNEVGLARTEAQVGLTITPLRNCKDCR